MQFPVELSTGRSHDIDELSSGEKEIVYGYLWLRTGTPRKSVVLIDEPELHLNPALVQGLVTFYKTHIAEALDSQVWIVTHSDAILRQAVRAPNTAVFHMARPDGRGAQQARAIGNQDAVEAAVLDLVGDLAAYRPHARIVLVEGNKETKFDVDMIRRLFPDLAERANLIPAGNRKTTLGVQSRLIEVLADAGLTGRAVSICDGDFGLEPHTEREGQYFWPVYEIENFLLDPRVIRGAAATMLRVDPFGTDAEVIERLRQLARPLVDALAVSEVQMLLDSEFVNAINIGGSPRNAVAGLALSTQLSKERLAAIDCTNTRVASLVDDASRRIAQTLDSTDFLSRLPGDRLIRALAGSLNVSGDHFRNACLDVAQRLNLRPTGMRDVLVRAVG